ncbi:MAG: 16S rRNA (adenine(1518)-N(6)/adenine(1519)-N(6))-dimethyltransferase RsmA [Rhodomicrobium sp.]
MTEPDPIALLPPLREAIKAAGLSAKKSLGQNFLLDLNIARRITRAAGPLKGITVLEIGPGPGGLTRALLLEGAARVIAIERDERFRSTLAHLEECSGGRLRVVFRDALQIDYEALAAQEKVERVVANLPYNIATPLILGWLTAELWPPWFDKLVVMVQREVGERFIAAPGTKSYGRLAVLAQYQGRPRILFTLPPSVFVPPPKVSSALVEFTPRIEPGAVPIRLLEKVTAAAFGQRRKMLRSSLAGLSQNAAALLRNAGIDPSRRAEELSVEEFASLAAILAR